MPTLNLPEFNRGLFVKTLMGSFEIAISENTPETSSYFSNLAKAGKLNDSKVFRIATDENQSLNTEHPIEVIQIGKMAGFDVAKDKISHEDTGKSGLSHKKWTVSVARFQPGEVYKSFFICMRDEPELDLGGNRSNDGLGFAAFGQVIKGFSVVEEIFGKAEANEMLEKPISVEAIEAIE